MLTVRRRRWISLLLLLLFAGAAVRVEWGARSLARDGHRSLLAWSHVVAASVEQGSDPEHFWTGSDRFDGEWALVTCQMASLGLARVAQQFPDEAHAFQGAGEACGRWLASEQARRFGTEAWGRDALQDTEAAQGHLYLGWQALGLGAALQLASDPARVAAHAAMVDHLAQRLDQLPVHRLETYPGEVYPPDIAIAAAAVAHGGRHPEVLARFWPRFEAAAIDPATGLLIQSLHPGTGAARDLPRGSGTALAASVLSEANPRLAAKLAAALHRELHTGLAGFGAVREAPRGSWVRGDIDSGPVLLGVSVSATGFGIGAARVADDRVAQVRLARTAHLFGVPVGGRARWHFATGGALGNAILLAMFTTPAAQLDGPGAPPGADLGCRRHDGAPGLVAGPAARR